MKNSQWSFHRCFSSRARFRATLRDAKKSQPCLRLPRGAIAPEARATPRSRDARRRTRPRPASSGDAVGGSARRSRDRAANATRTNRLFVDAPPKPSTRATKRRSLQTRRSRRGVFARLASRTLPSRTHAYASRVRTLTHHPFPSTFTRTKTMTHRRRSTVTKPRLRLGYRRLRASWWRGRRARPGARARAGPARLRARAAAGTPRTRSRRTTRSSRETPRSAAGTWGGG